MQHQHSCGTLERRIKIFGCTVQALIITLYPLFCTVQPRVTPGVLGGSVCGGLQKPSVN